MVKLFCYDISHMTQEQFCALYQKSDRQRREKTDRLKSIDAKKRSVAAGFLARTALAQQLHMAPCDIVFQTDQNGKPYAAGTELQFSLSHSGTLAVCAVSDRAVGIDVEQKKDVLLSVAKRCFTEAEQRYVFSTKDHRQARFLEIWTKKEAYVKLLGTGIKDFLTFDVLQNEHLYTLYYQNYIVSVATM